MYKKQFIKDLEIGKKVEDLFSVKYKQPLKQYKNGFMFSLVLSDKTGEIDATYWGGDERDIVQKLYNEFKEGDVIYISCSVGEYKNKLIISINDRDIIKKFERYNVEDFVPKTKNDIEKMVGRINEAIFSLNDSNLKTLLESFFTNSEFIHKFKNAPAAMYIHHAYLGGLLEHTVNVVELCETICRLYPQLDRNLTITGAILHDIGKIKEFDVTTNIKVSEEGLLLGHTVIGTNMVLERLNEINDYPKNLKDKLLHILLSHHGKVEYGSPIEPLFAEAWAVYSADEYDSRLSRSIKVKEDAKVDDNSFYTYNKIYGKAYLK